VLRGGREVVLSGGIGPGFAKAVDTILESQPRLETLHLNLQNGGLVGEADKARRAIKSKGIRTYVSETCVSACTIVLAGGKERYAASGAKGGRWARTSRPRAEEKNIGAKRRWIAMDATLAT
jgi:hypothetical protein